MVFEQHPMICGMAIICIVGLGLVIAQAHGAFYFNRRGIPNIPDMPDVPPRQALDLASIRPGLSQPSEKDSNVVISEEALLIAIGRGHTHAVMNGDAMNAKLANSICREIRVALSERGLCVSESAARQRY